MRSLPCRAATLATSAAVGGTSPTLRWKSPGLPSRSAFRCIRCTKASRLRSLGVVLGAPSAAAAAAAGTGAVAVAVTATDAAADVTVAGAAVDAAVGTATPASSPSSGTGAPVSQRRRHWARVRATASSEWQASSGSRSCDAEG
eukprot:scaffold99123_cov57-Phaeocystis_antarctica.AAC.1